MLEDPRGERSPALRSDLGDARDLTLGLGRQASELGLGVALMRFRYRCAFALGSPRSVLPDARSPLTTGGECLLGLGLSRLRDRTRVARDLVDGRKDGQ